MRTIDNAIIKQIDAATNTLLGGSYEVESQATLDIAPDGFDAAVIAAGVHVDLFSNGFTDLFDDEASSSQSTVSQNLTTNAGSIQLTATTLTSRAGTVDNTGRINADRFGTFAVTDSDGNRGTLNVTGAEGQVSGINEIDADLVVTDGGTVSPGNHPNQVSTLSVLGDVTFATGDDAPNLEVDIDDLNADRLFVSGDLVLDGTVHVNVTEDVPLLGGTFQDYLILFAASGSITGNFSDVIDNSDEFAFTTYVNESGNRVFLRATVVPEPAAASVLLALCLRFTRRRARG
ncbi:MAG: hypothetical protein AAFX76_03670 [Planctomycetota bacterium]